MEGTVVHHVYMNNHADSAVRTPTGEQQLRKLVVEGHAPLTSFTRAAALLADWPAALERFWQLAPPSEANTPKASQVAAERGTACSPVGVAA